jgi:hypothetical protein
MTLFSYCLRYDDGAAPNPYWGMCSLAICKPAIRRMARKGDWVLGLGSTNAPRLGNISGDMVYAMKVTRVLSMPEYDEFCRESLHGKIPDWNNSDFRRRVGDCIYDFGSGGTPLLRRSVHTERNRERDLSGRSVLLSTHFYYFGDEPEILPKRLSALAHPTQGHKSHANDPYINEFIKWIENRGWKRNTILGEPQLKDKILSMTKQECRSFCSEQHREEDEQDEVC